MRGSKFIVPIALAAAMVLSGGACTLLVGDDDRVTICSFNVQNLFDARFAGTEYDEFAASSGWSDDDYHERMRRLSEVLLRTNPSIDVLALIEIENAAVAKTLRDTYLPDLPLAHVAVTDVPGSAVQVGVLSRYPIVAARSHLPAAEGDYRLRAILEVHLDVDGDPLALFVNHWKSKRGGAAATAPLRREAARTVTRRVTELHRESPALPVVLCGDFNESPFEYEIVGDSYATAFVPPASSVQTDNEVPGEAIVVVDDREAVLKDTPGAFYTPWRDCSDCAAPGSYAYRGIWEQIDGFFLNRALFDGQGLEFARFAVVATDDTLGPDGFPDRWDGSRGVSDHLPVLLVLFPDATAIRRQQPAILSPVQPTRGLRLAMRGSGAGFGGLWDARSSPAAP